MMAIEEDSPRDISRQTETEFRSPCTIKIIVIITIRIIPIIIIKIILMITIRIIPIITIVKFTANYFELYARHLWKKSFCNLEICSLDFLPILLGLKALWEKVLKEGKVPPFSSIFAIFLPLTIKAQHFWDISAEALISGGRSIEDHQETAAKPAFVARASSAT